MKIHTMMDEEYNQVSRAIAFMADSSCPAEIALTIEILDRYRAECGRRRHVYEYFQRKKMLSKP